MKTIELTISTPDGSAFEGPAEGVSVRGVEGDLKILADHVPFVTALAAGRCKVDTEDGNSRTGKLDGGLLTVAANRVTILSGSFRWDDEEG